MRSDFQNHRGTESPRLGVSLARPGRESLSIRDVHVWFAYLGEREPLFDPLYLTLAEDELERAERFQVPVSRKQFVLGRGMLRKLLSQYSRTDPRELQFTYGPQGKPSLLSGPFGANLSFNLCHTEGAVVCAVSCNCELGIDLEHVRENLHNRDIAEQYFSPREKSLLARVAPEAFQEIFSRVLDAQRGLHKSSRRRVID